MKVDATVDVACSMGLGETLPDANKKWKSQIIECRFRCVLIFFHATCLHAVLSGKCDPFFLTEIRNVLSWWRFFLRVSLYLLVIKAYIYNRYAWQPRKQKKLAGKSS